MTDDPIVHAHHLQAPEVRLCVRGARQWFRLHGLSFEDFIQHGIPCSKLEALNDALANKVCAHVRSESAS